jgi:hypothetical protein
VPPGEVAVHLVWHEHTRHDPAMARFRDLYRLMRNYGIG